MVLYSYPGNNILQIGRSILSEQEYWNFQNNHEGSSLGKLDTNNPNHKEFDTSFVIECISPGNFSNGLALSSKNAIKISKGDQLYISFYARSLDNIEEAGHGQLIARFGKSLIFPVLPDHEWKKYSYSCKSIKDYPAGSDSLVFKFGFEPQILEIGGIRFIKFDSATGISKLPVNKVIYEGQQTDAEWRHIARKQIDSLHTSQVNIKVLDNKGLPLPRSTVNFKMIKHAFTFGTAVNGRMLFDTSENGAKHRDALKTYFNHAVLENCLKWKRWDKNQSIAVESVEWLTDNNYPVRGHCTTHKKYYKKLIAYLAERDLIDGIGMQAPFGGILTSPVELWRVLDEFAVFGLPIVITEFDVLTSYGATLWNLEWEPKPNARVWKQLVFDEWLTNKTGYTGLDGTVSRDVFQGIYEITATFKIHSKTLMRVEIMSKFEELIIQLD